MGVFKQLTRSLLAGRFARSVAILAGGTAIGQVLVVLISPILTRLYTPGDFGILAVYIACLSIVGAVASLSYDFAIPLPEDDLTGVSVVVLSLMIMLGMSGLAGLVVWLLGDQIVGLLGVPELKPYLWLVPLGLLGVGAYQSFNGWAIRKGDFGRIAQTKLSQSIGKVLAQVGLGFLSSGPFGLLVGDVIGRASGTSTLAALAWKRDRVLLRQVRVADVRRAAYRYRRFPLLSSGATLLNSLGLRLPTLLLASVYGAHVVGWLELGERILAGPLTLIGAAVGQVYVSEAAKAMHSNPEQLPKLFMKVVGSLLLISLPYILIFSLLAPTFFPIIFGAEWAESGVYMRLLAVMFLIQSIASPTGGTIDVLERQDLHLIREIVRVVLLSGVALLIGALQLEPAAGIALFGLAGSIIYLLYLGMSFYAIKASLKKARTASKAEHAHTEHEELASIP